MVPVLNPAAAVFHKRFGYQLQCNQHRRRDDYRIIPLADERNPVRYQIEAQQRLADRESRRDLCCQRRARVLLHAALDDELALQGLRQRRQLARCCLSCSTEVMGGRQRVPWHR